jgi:tight adherence protein B
MVIIVVVAFVSIFALAGLIALATTSGGMKKDTQTATRLDAVVAAPKTVQEKPLDVRRSEGTSMPWLNKVLENMAVVPSLRLLLYQAGMDWTPPKLAAWSLGAFGIAAFAVYSRTELAIVACAFGLLAGAAPFGFVFKKRGMRFSAFEKDLPAALDLMVGALRAGHSLNSAIGMVSKEMADPIGREFRTVFDEQMFGLEMRTALTNLTERVPLQSVRIMVTAILIQKETGGNLAEVLEKAAHVNRERFRLMRQIRVHTAQGRMTGWVLTLLPLVLGTGLYFLDPEHMSILWRRPEGQKVLGAATVMTFIGGLLIRKVVNVRV